MSFKTGRRPTDDEQAEALLFCDDGLTPTALSTTDNDDHDHDHDHDARPVENKSGNDPAMADGLTNEKLALVEKDRGAEALGRPQSRIGALDAQKGLAVSGARTRRPRAHPWHRVITGTCFWVMLLANIFVYTGAYRPLWRTLWASPVYRERFWANADESPSFPRPGPHLPLPPLNSTMAMVPRPSNSTTALLPPDHSTPAPQPSPSAITSAIRPGPTAAPASGPRHREAVMLADLGRGHSEVWVWHRTRNNTLVRRAMHRPGATWEDGGGTGFLGAPVVAPASDLGWQSHLAFAVESATGAMQYSVWQARGGWQEGGAWTSIGGRRFVYQPTVAVSSRGAVTVMAVGADGYLHYNELVGSHPEPRWDGWRIVASGFAGEVALAPPRLREHREHPVYLVGLKDGQYQYAKALRGPFNFGPLGVPDPCRGRELGWPRLLQHYGDPAQLFVACAGRVWNKAYDHATGTWSAEWRAFGDGPPGLHHLAHGQAATTARLLSRASDGCVYHIGRHGLVGPNQPLWDPWQKLWCPAAPRNLTADDARDLTLAVAERPGSLVSVLIGDVGGELYYNRLLSLSFHEDGGIHAAQPFETVELPE